MRVETGIIRIMERFDSQVFYLRVISSVFSGVKVAYAEDAFREVHCTVQCAGTGSAPVERIPVIVFDQRRIIPCDDDALREAFDCESLVREFHEINSVSADDLIVTDNQQERVSPGFPRFCYVEDFRRFACCFFECLRQDFDRRGDAFSGSAVFFCFFICDDCELEFSVLNQLQRSVAWCFFMRDRRQRPVVEVIGGQLCSCSGEQESQQQMDLCFHYGVP